MPGKHMKADIYLELGNIEDSHGKPQAWLARVDLTKLGLTVRWKRKIGEIKYVYVKTGTQDATNLHMK
jgi:hypothetical protein